MFDATAILTVAGTFLVLLCLSILIARFLLWAILASMQHAAHRGFGAAFVPAPTRQSAKSNVCIGELRENSYRK